MTVRPVRSIYIGAKMLVNVLVLTSVIGLVIQAWPNQSISSTSDPLPINLPTMLLLAVLVRLGMSRYARQLIWRKESPESVDIPSDEFIQFAEKTFLERFDLAVVQQLVGTMIDPAGYFDRVTERIEVQTSRYERTTNLTFRIPSTASKTLLVPLLSQKKQTLVDGLDVSVDGSPGSTLSYIENQGATLLALELLFEDLRPRRLLTDALLADCKRVLATPYASNQRPVLRNLEAAVPKRIRSESQVYAALYRMIEFCANSYFILGVVEPSDARTAKIVIESSFDRAPSNTSGILGLLRIALGLRRRDHLFTLERAYESVSYHFSLRTPKGMYVHENVLTYHEIAAKIPTASETHPPTNSLPAVRSASTLPESRRTRSTKFVHVYLRDHAAGELQASIPSLRLNMRERPPGLVEVCWLLSCGLCLLVWVAGAYHHEIFEAKTQPGSWPTVLFGIPALLSGWLVSRVNASVLSRISLMTLVCCAWLAVNSIAAITAAAFKSGGLQATETGFVMLETHVTHPIWAAVMVSCLTHAVVTGYCATARSLRYGLILNGLTDNSIPEHNERSGK